MMMNLIFLIIFNAMFFILGGTDHPMSVWISYGFVHFAYFMLLATPYLVRTGKSAAVFGFSLYAISTTYFFIELIAGIIFILVSPESYKAAFLVQFFISGGYAVCFISNMMANEYTAEAEEKRQYEITYVKNATAEMASLLSGISDRETKKKVEKVYDAINASPVKSHPNVSSLESQILVAITELRNSIGETKSKTVQNQADALLTMVNERNRQLKLVN
jgi:hypothetical protein